jgi:undecaprenyl-phosphate 4-deoxy-4-formamido-L-arabinose transferase
MKPVDISIVIPVYNSESCLDELNQQIMHELANYDYELILVNDKSPDSSWQKIVSLTRINPRIKGVSLKKNSGQDNAIMAGLGQATGGYVVIMDDDLQHSPEDIIKLYDKCSEGFDICYGLFPDKKQRFWKNLGSKVNEWIAELFLKKPKGLYLSPFKIMRSSLVQEIKEYKGPFPYVDGIVLSLTSNITQLELVHRKRYHGRGNYNILRSVSVFLKHVTGYSLYPLRFATILGIMAAGASFLLGAFFLIDYLTNDRRVEGWITLVLLSVFFNGLILMCLGLIGEYVGRVYLTLTSKRQYVIDDIVGSDFAPGHAADLQAERSLENLSNLDR